MIIILIIVSIISCTRQLQKPGQDEAARFYKEGLGYLHENELVQAELSFNHALEIQKDYAPAYEGLSRVYFQHGQFGKAKDLAVKSLKLNKNWLPARIIKARIYLAEGDYDLSRDELLLALKQTGSLKLPSLKSTIHQLLARNYLLQRNFTEAEKQLKAALALKANNKEALTALHEIEEDLACLRGKQEGILELAAKLIITRADFAENLFYELKDQNNFQTVNLENDKLPIAHDVRQGRQAYKAVHFCLKNKLLPLLPDSTFRPDDKVDRAEAAIFLKNILSLVRSDSVYQNGPFSAKKPFYKDVAEMDVYYRDVQTVTYFNLMPASIDGYFRPQEFISGLQGVKIINKLKEFLISK